jgi:hypothetical protein
MTLNKETGFWVDAWGSSSSRARDLYLRITFG